MYIYLVCIQLSIYLHGRKEKIEGNQIEGNIGKGPGAYSGIRIVGPLLSMKFAEFF